MTEHEFTGWLVDPVTKAVFALLAVRKEELKERWASGAFTDQGQFATAIANAKAIGQCEEISFVLDLDFSQLQEPQE